MAASACRRDRNVKSEDHGKGFLTEMQEEPGAQEQLVGMVAEAVSPPRGFYQEPLLGAP